MKNIPGWLAFGCLALGLAGCESNDVQTGYLTPQQTASSSAPAPADSQAPAPSQQPAATTDTTAASSERLPAPSATQQVSEEQEKAVEEKSEAKSEEAASQNAAPTAAPKGASLRSGKSASVSTRTGNTSPPAENQPTASVGGKFGQQKATASTWKPREEPEAPAERAEQPSARRSVAKVERDEDDDEEAPARTTPAVSSSFRPSETRVLEPQGSAKGVVVRTNEKAKFVVIKFQYKAFPSVGKVLSVLRNGEKVGQIRITKPVKPPHATGDVLEGDVRIGDSVE